jgi:cytochrome c556
MIRPVLAVAIFALGVSVVAAQDPIAERQKLMKQNSADARVLREMGDGKRPFDLATAKKSFANLAAAADKLKGLFPPTSMKGDTKALPVIWEKKSDFDALLAKFGNEAKAAEAATKDLDTMKAQLGVVAKNCGGCHNTYRAKSS